LNQRICVLTALALLFGCTSIPVVPKGEMASPLLQFNSSTFVYPSGLRVLLEHEQASNLAGVFVSVNVGSTSDPAGKEGLAHYVQHLTLSARAGSGPTFGERLDQAGVLSRNAFTRLESTVYYEVGLRSRLGEMIRLEGGRMASPLGDSSPAERATELSVVRNELRELTETDAGRAGFDAVQSALFLPAFPYARPAIGTQASLSAIGPDDPAAFVAAHYKPSNTTLLIASELDSTAVKTLLDANLPAALREGAPPVKRLLSPVAPAAPPVPEEPPASPVLLRKEAAVGGPELWIAWSMPRLLESDTWLERLLPGLVQYRLQDLWFGDDKNEELDIASVSAEVEPLGAQASVLLMRVHLRKGDHPQKTLDAVLERLATLWETPTLQKLWDGWQFAELRQSIEVAEVGSLGNLSSRAIRRLEAMRLTGSQSFISDAVLGLVVKQRHDVAAAGSPYVTPARARAVLLVPYPADEQGSVAQAALEDGREETPAAGGPPGWEVARLQEELAPPQQRAVYRLPNGLSVVLEPRPGLPLLLAGLSFASLRTDERDVAAARAMNTRGTTLTLQNGRPESLGATIETSSGPTYEIQGLAGNAAQLLAMLGEYVRTQEMDEHRWKLVRDIALPSERRWDPSPDAVAHRAFIAKLYAGTPFAIPLRAAALESLSAGQAEDWLARQLTPQGATLAVVGDFDPAAMQKMVLATFGDWTGPPRPAPPAPPQALEKASATELIVTPRPRATQSSLQFGCLASPASDLAVDQRHDVSAMVLERRLFRRLREQLGATYGIRAHDGTWYGGTSSFEASGAIETGKLSSALAAISGTLRSLRDEPPGAEELAWAKVKVADARALAALSNRGAAGVILVHGGTGLALDASDAEQIGQVTAAQVQEDFQTCLTSRPTLSIVGDEAAARAAFAASWHAP
jgi:zinc protease